MQLFSRVAKKYFGNLVPDLENGKLIEQLLTNILNLFFVLDAFLNEHHDLLMVVINIVVFEDLAFSVATQNLQEFLTFAMQLLADLLHDMHICLVSG